jgi:hypothetical protein
VKLFSCDQCHNLAYFDNARCTHCGATLGFLPQALRLAALEPADDLWRVQGDNSGQRWRQCGNYREQGICNWMVAADDDEPFCVACRLNRTIPDLSIEGNLQLWQKLEQEKRRLVYSLLRLNLPLEPMTLSPTGLAFDFLADTAPTFNERGRVLTGHAQGLITINIAEADPVVREKMRHDMAEPYRTVLGHFRHESGHYYWDRLIRDSAQLASWRELFGDERADYSAALEQHYRQGPAPAWQQRFVSAYAASHPWEDWAETWAHYLHMVDTLETAQQFGLRTQPQAASDDSLSLDTPLNAYSEPDISRLFHHWVALTIALNSLNRSMGHEHAYPFVLSETVRDKLTFVHRLVQQNAGG